MSMFALAIAVTALALLTAASAAVRNVSRIWLRHWAERRLQGAAAADLFLEQPQRLLAVASTASALVIVITGVMIGRDSAASWVTLFASLGTAAIALLFVGRILPRALARRWSPMLVPVLMPALRLLAVLLRPMHALSRAAAQPFVRPSNSGEQDERDGLADLLREGELEGVGEREESVIISGVVEFGAKTLGEVMTQRSEVFALDVATPGAELARAIAQSGFSRVPLYRGGLDHVTGMVHVFDLLKAQNGEAPRVRPVSDAPTSRHCNEQLFEMLRRRIHLAIVRDDAGHVAGIVTLEDLLEELVGDIRDEHDEPVAARPAAGAAAGAPA